MAEFNKYSILALSFILLGNSGLLSYYALATDSSVYLDQSVRLSSKSELWNQYREIQKSDPLRRKENQDKVIEQNGLRMRYAYSKVGEKPVSGYPLYIALHGGGGASPSLNDSQWEHMKVYYRESVKNGIYLAPRGVTDTWNLHFVDASYAMYDRLIENMILFEEVDPNRVYVLGFSAGGDGVYQIATRMSDRFAAANMSAGHPNGVNLKNLYQLPFLIQVGELDSAYNRNRVDAEYCIVIQDFQKLYPDGYSSECNIHFQRPHNFLDNQPHGVIQKVIADPKKWLVGQSSEVITRDTNAIHWLDRFERNPIPERVIWDLTTRAPRSGSHGQSHYWLDIGSTSLEALGASEIIARLERKENLVVVEKVGSYLRILLKQEMLDLSKPIHVKVGDQTFDFQAKPNLETKLKTLNDRGDVNYIFDVVLELTKDLRDKSRFKLSQL